MGREAEEELMQMMQTDKLELISHVDCNCSQVETLDQLFADHNPMALDLLKKMLVISP